MNVVLVMFKDDERRDFPLPAEKTILGRRRDCELRIPTRDVSRQHCELAISGSTLTVRDMGSSNGTFVNGKRVAETELSAGDRLRVGPVTFLVQIDGKPADIQPERDVPRTEVSPTAADSADEETFELTEADFDIDFGQTDDEKDMP